MYILSVASSSPHDESYPHPKRQWLFLVYIDAKYYFLSFFITRFIVILMKSCLNSSLLWKGLSYFCFNSSIAPSAGAMEEGWVQRPSLKTALAVAPTPRNISGKQSRTLCRVRSASHYYLYRCSRINTIPAPCMLTKACFRMVIGMR